jgi:hypothetical protein
MHTNTHTGAGGWQKGGVRPHPPPLQHLDAGLKMNNGYKWKFKLSRGGPRPHKGLPVFFIFVFIRRREKIQQPHYDDGFFARKKCTRISRCVGGTFFGSEFHAAAVNQNDCYSSELADVGARCGEHLISS